MTQAKCTPEQYQELFRQLNKTRKTSKTVTVDRTSLFNLLQDHQMLWQQVSKGGLA